MMKSCAKDWLYGVPHRSSLRRLTCDQMGQVPLRNNKAQGPAFSHIIGAKS